MVGSADIELQVRENGKRLGNMMYDQEIKLRFMCCRLVEGVPSQGLLELCKTLKDIHEFYLPQLEQESLLLSQLKQVRVGYGTRSVRPEFPVVYNEGSE